ncbi:hypothetical protein HPB47_006366 [Ixodes persulcatus]|uniref:Uncharacterized protein n=1 Tax=Ixodes persulcatus TaxID=34615 RepID=A0AC60PAD3_IXOPE|nr:hypothetical protein HPB47_006366 [Ixodes persulcatus]
MGVWARSSPSPINTPLKCDVVGVSLPKQPSGGASSESGRVVETVQNGVSFLLLSSSSAFLLVQTSFFLWPLYLLTPFFQAYPAMMAAGVLGCVGSAIHCFDAILAFRDLKSGNAAPRLAEVAEVVFVRTAAVLAGLRCKDRWRQLVRWFSSERRQVT